MRLEMSTSKKGYNDTFVYVFQNALVVHNRKTDGRPNLVAKFQLSEVRISVKQLEHFLQTPFGNSLLDVFSDVIVVYYRKSKFGRPSLGFGSSSLNENGFNNFLQTR